MTRAIASKWRSKIAAKSAGAAAEIASLSGARWSTESYCPLARNRFAPDRYPTAAVAPRRRRSHRLQPAITAPA